MRRILSLGIIFLCLFSFASYSDSAFTQRKDVQQFIKHMVKKYNFNERELIKTMSEVHLQPQVIESMEKPYEKKSWMSIKSFFLPQRV